MSQIRHLQYLIDRSLFARSAWNQEEIEKREAWRAEIKELKGKK
jgi:hypothetical protein